MVDVVVLGGGAAGLMCAATAASSGKRVVLLESNNRVGAKIRISGGGRCNFTNREVTHRNFVSSNPDFCRSALSRYTPQDFLALVASYNIKWHEKKLGQLFCDGSAQQIIDMLVAECRNASVDIRLNASVSSVDAYTNVDALTYTDVHASVDVHTPFVVQVNGAQLHTQAVVVACGGLSIPTLGASDLGYRIAKKFRIPLLPTHAALVPFTFDESWKRQFAPLAGVSADASITCNGVSFRENLLFTHKGLSGPAILQVSSYWKKGDEVIINFFPDHDAEDLLPESGDKRHFATLLAHLLPQRLVQAWPDARIHEPSSAFARTTQLDIIRQFQHWVVKPTGTEGYAKAEVTRGGVDTNALSQKTMECKSVPGLYFIGEVVDVTGWLGGYNFQWAWASGVAAGRALQ